MEDVFLLVLQEDAQPPKIAPVHSWVRACAADGLLWVGLGYISSRMGRKSRRRRTSSVYPEHILEPLVLMVIIHPGSTFSFEDRNPNLLK